MATDRDDTSDRALRARIAAHSKWAQTPDRAAATQPARTAFLRRFEREVDPEGKLAPDVRARLADNAKSAHFSRLALRSVQSRRKKKKKANF